MTDSQCLYSFRHSSDVLCVDFSPDSKLLITGCLTGAMKVCDDVIRCNVMSYDVIYICTIN